MAIGTFHSLRGEKSALVMVKANDLVMSADPVYVPRSAVVARCKVEDEKALTKGMEFAIPDGYRLVDIMDIETGEVRTTKDGAHLKTLAYG